MTDDAHDMGLMTFIIDGVAHSLAVQGEAFVILPIGSVPALQCAVEMHGIDADEVTYSLGTTRRQPKRSRAFCPKLSAQSEMAL